MDALAVVCRSNGGGIRVRCKVGDDGYGLPVNASYRRLQSLGLIQGKAGDYETVVHTREGLALYRATSPQAASAQTGQAQGNVAEAGVSQGTSL